MADDEADDDDRGKSGGAETRRPVSKRKKESSCAKCRLKQPQNADDSFDLNPAMPEKAVSTQRQHQECSVGRPTFYVGILPGLFFLLRVLFISSLKLFFVILTF